MSSFNSFVNKVLETEEVSYNKSFNKQFVYKDAAGGKPTTFTCSNSDFGFQG